MNSNPKVFYQSKLLVWSNELTQLKKKLSFVSWARFIDFVALLFVAYQLFSSHFSTSSLILLCALVIIFFVLLSISTKLNSSKTFLEVKSSLLEIELKHLDHKYEGYNGLKFYSAEHAFAEDLDLFGDYSLYRFFNRAASFQGQKLVADRLQYFLPFDSISDVQMAAKALSADFDWRNDFQAYGKTAPISKEIVDRLSAWSAKEPTKYPTFLVTLSWLFPLFSICSLLLYLNDSVSGGTYAILFLISFIISRSLSAKNNTLYSSLDKIAPSVLTLSKELSCIEILDVKDSKVLKDLQSQIGGDSDHAASIAIAKLHTIMEGFDVRNNLLAFFLLNTFLLWDVHMAIRLVKWQKKYQLKIAQWNAVIAEMEFLNSVATCFFNHPEWNFPTVTNSYYSLEAKSLGHPLLDEEKRIDNDLVVNGAGKIMLVTGSNMGGKSTFLRSVGLNCILAYIGAPVCAEKMSVSYAKLMSSMRISDNLQESTSTFYAELKKLRRIIQAVNGGEKVFVLLDEILRGTNTLDRHSGAKALMQQLIKNQISGIVATHDIELTHLVESYPNAIENYHFDVQVGENDNLFFDYKLKSGICQQMNAAILMRQIGIEL